MNLKDLSTPFPEDEIEWRIGQSGKKGNGQVWATCLAYVQARAIMNRLDAVCGPENWRASYRFIPASIAVEPGVICELAIKCGSDWITKEDGAAQTDIESFKGGISGALKRAAVLWGVGRYLYSLEKGHANIANGKQVGALWAKTKDGTEFYWIPPNLPAWALPPGSTVKRGGIYPDQPGEGDGVITPSEYKITFGKWSGRTLEQIYNEPKGGPLEMANYINWLEDSAAKNNKPLSQDAIRLIAEAEKFLAAMENGS